MVEKLDTVPVYSRGVDGSDYVPGLIGLNNIKNTDYVNVVVQLLARIPRPRLFPAKSNDARKSSPLLAEFGELVRKCGLVQLQGQVSRRLLQAIMHASNNLVGKQADPMDFLAWLLNSLHALGGTRKPGSSVIHQALQGKVRILHARLRPTRTKSTTRQRTRWTRKSHLSCT